MSDFLQGRSRMPFLTICAAASLCLGYGRFLSAEPGPNKDKPAAEVVGSWQQVVAVIGKEVRPPKDDGTEAKLLHITPTHFTRIVYNPKTTQLMGVVGGTCALAVDKYTETIAYADEASRKQAQGQAPLVFQYKINGEMMTLTLSAGATAYSETWKRVK